MKFSTRTQWDMELTPWARLLRSLREKAPTDARLLDLTASNPTRCDFNYDPDSLLLPLTAPSSLIYDPDPKGSLAARAAILNYYADRGMTIDGTTIAVAAEDDSIGPENLLLTSSSSEAYSFLFRLLADPGDQILIAQPGYPLLDFLAQIDDVVLKPYPLLYDHGWQIDWAALDEIITPRTRAIALVHPNNPTGHFTSDSDRQTLVDLCRRRGLALIVDEVFLDYGMAGPGKSFVTGSHPPLTFVISGISKIAGLPQMKLSWIVSPGDSKQAVEARQRLEIIADTFLPVSTPVACALPSWLERRGDIQQQILARLRGNLSSLDRLLARQSMVSRLEFEAGWYAVLRVPALVDQGETALDLLRDSSVAVHAGEFFGFPPNGWLVISLLPPEEIFTSGVTALLNFFNH